MDKYHKIHAPFKRNDAGKRQKGTWARPEFSTLYNIPWHAWEKLDGMNIRIIHEGGDIRYAGRTDNAQLQPGLIQHLDDVWRDAASFLAGAMGTDHFTLFGEGIGPKIQSGGLYGKAPQFIPFDLQFHDGGWCDRFELNRLIDEVCNLPFAAYLGCQTLQVWEEFCEEKRYLRSMVPGANLGCPSEGYIAIPESNLLDSRGNRIITKIKFKDYA